MKVGGCEFPDDLLYDEEGFVWARADGSDVVVGITSLFAAVAGKPTRITAKAQGTTVARGQSIGTVESGRYFGVVRTPVAGTITATNDAVFAKPKLIVESCYGDGWFARLRPSTWVSDRDALRPLPAAKEFLASQVEALHVRCFSAYPDVDMVEIGVECAAVLVKLNDLLAQAPLGYVVHIVSDDATAEVEMARWSDETGQAVLEVRREGRLTHFLVRRVR